MRYRLEGMASVTARPGTGRLSSTRALRDETGPAVGLLVDANCAYGAADAIACVRSGCRN
jgi:L-alanine-DL-glutamate epimerase-like enolase superfamily enzyme